MALTENFVSLVGRIAREPELRFVGEQPKSSFSIARNEQKRVGNTYEDLPTEFFNVECWRKLAEQVANLPVGAHVRVTGKIRISSWEKNGEKQYRTYVDADSVSLETILVREIDGEKGQINLVYGGGQDREQAPRPQPEQRADYDEEPF